jgi:hypothetical protein
MSPTWFEFGPTAALSGRPCEGRLLCRFSDAGNNEAGHTLGDRRRKSAKARNRGGVQQPRCRFLAIGCVERTRRRCCGGRNQTGHALASRAASIRWAARRIAQQDDRLRPRYQSSHRRNSPRAGHGQDGSAQPFRTDPARIGRRGSPEHSVTASSPAQWPFPSLAGISRRLQR